MDLKPIQLQNSGDAAMNVRATDSASPRMTASPRNFSFLWLWGLGGLVFLSVLGTVVWWGSDYFFTTPTPAPRAIAQGGALLKSTLTSTPTFTPTKTPTVTPTFTPTNTPTFTPTFTPTNTPTITPTFTPSLTFTPRPTNTPRPPTNTPAALPTLGIFNGVGGGDVAGRWIDVNLSRQQVVAYEGSKAIASFIVSTGTWQYPTVTGKYNIYVKYVAQTMWGEGYYLPNVPYVMYFYQGYGLHGTYWHNNFGTPMSHGCVNLRTIDAAWLYNFASIGTLVNVHY